MGAYKTSDIAKVGHDVLSTTQSEQTGLITAQLGDVVTEDATANEAEWNFPPGLVGRVRKPDAKQKAAQVVALTRSGNDAILGCRDERVASIVGQLDDGETAVFASAAGGGVAIFKKDGSITVRNGAGSLSVTVSASGVAVGGPAAQALAFGSALQVVTEALSAFATSVQGDQALKVLAPITVGAAGTLVTALSTLIASFAQLGQTKDTTAS